MFLHINKEMQDCRVNTVLLIVRQKHLSEEPKNKN